MPNGPTTPAAGSLSAVSSGEKTSPVGSIEPSTATTIGASERRQPGVAGGRPAGVVAEPHDLDVVAVGPALDRVAGHVGDHELEPA